MAENQWLTGGLGVVLSPRNQWKLFPGHSKEIEWNQRPDAPETGGESNKAGRIETCEIQKGFVLKWWLNLQFDVEYNL